MARLRSALAGTGPLSGIGVAIWLAGLAMLCSILMTPDGWGWWMDVHATPGHEADGIVYYDVAGNHYTVTDPQWLSGSAPHARAVYYLADEPGGGSLHDVGTKVIDWSATAGPGVVGAAFVAAGFRKRTRRKRLSDSQDRRESFGYGIPADTISAILGRDAPGSRSG